MRLLSLALLLAAAACGGERGRATAQTAQGAPTAMPMPATGTRMAGDSMRMMAAALRPALRAHLDSLASVSAATRRAALAGGDTLVRRVLDAMHTDLMHLGMQDDAHYQALADSVARDRSALAQAPPAEQDRLLRAHVARVRRLVATYDRMVAEGR